MVKMDLDSSQAQADAVSNSTAKQSGAYALTLSALSSFEGTEALSGAAYGAAKNYAAQVLPPLIQGAQLLSEGLATATSRFPAEYADRVAPESLDSDALQTEIDTLYWVYGAETQTLSLLYDKKKKRASDYVAISRLENETAQLKHRLEELQEKYDDLLAFDAYSPSIFSELSGLEAAVFQGLAQVQQSFTHFDGSFTIPQKSDMAWATRIANYIFAKEYQVRRPNGLNDEEYDVYLENIHSRVTHLEKVDGWDKAATKAYVKEVNVKIEGSSSLKDATEQANVAYQKTQEVGSNVYTSMYQASQYSSKKKLNLIMTHLGAEVDENNFLQLTGSHTLSSELEPMSAFYGYLRKDVQSTYKTKKGLNEVLDGEDADQSLGLKLHLFRSYIDKQNIDYIRKNYVGNNDYEKLQDYMKKKGVTADYTTGANYHNRALNGDFTYTQNMKVQLPKSNTMDGSYNNARGSEFIVDLETGNFVSEWNAYDKHYDTTTRRYDSDPSHYSKEEEYQIANTESYNYGPSHGANDDIPNSDKTHSYLDVKHPEDTVIREEAAKLYPYEKDLGKGNGKYVDIVKKEEDCDTWQKTTAGMSEQEKQEEYNKFKDYVANITPNKRDSIGYYDYSKAKR